MPSCIKCQPSITESSCTGIHSMMTANASANVAAALHGMLACRKGIAVLDHACEAVPWCCWHSNMLAGADWNILTSSRRAAKSHGDASRERLNDESCISHWVHRGRYCCTADRSSMLSTIAALLQLLQYKGFSVINEVVHSALSQSYQRTCSRYAGAVLAAPSACNSCQQRLKVHAGPSNHIECKLKFK